MTELTSGAARILFGGRAILVNNCVLKESRAQF